MCSSNARIGATLRRDVGSTIGDAMALIETILFALIAAFLFFRLKSVLGRRTGDERPRPNPFGEQQRPESRPDPQRPLGLPDNVTPFPGRRSTDGASSDAPPPSAPPALDPLQEPKPLAEGLAEVRALDPSFTEEGFISGARAAFGMIIDAYAKGDPDALRPLLSEPVFKNFIAAIDRRADRGESMETRIEAMEAADLADARADGRNVYVTVRFTTRQINVIRNAAGAVIDGDPDKAEEVVDLWTFARDSRSRDPNWALVGTRTP